MNLGHLPLSFSETVNVESFDVTQVVLQDAGVASTTFCLTGGSVSGSDVLLTPGRTARFFTLTLTLTELEQSEED